MTAKELLKEYFDFRKKEFDARRARAEAIMGQVNTNNNLKAALRDNMLGLIKAMNNLAMKDSNNPLIWDWDIDPYTSPDRLQVLLILFKTATPKEYEKASNVYNEIMESAGIQEFIKAMSEEHGLEFVFRKGDAEAAEADKPAG